MMKNAELFWKSIRREWYVSQVVILKFAIIHTDIYKSKWLELETQNANELFRQKENFEYSLISYDVMGRNFQSKYFK